jgi:jouberin
MSIFSIRVLGSTEVTSDFPMKNLIVRVSIASSRTGTLAEKIIPRSKCFSESEDTIFIPQVATSPIHCNHLGALKAIWAKRDGSDVFVYNEPVEIFEDPLIVITFELIDQTIHPRCDCFSAVAWGFLKTPQKNSPANVFGKPSVLQLYSYPSGFNTAVYGNGSLPLMNILYQRTPIPACLTVQLDKVDPASFGAVKAVARPRNVFEKEIEEEVDSEEEDDDLGDAGGESSPPVQQRGRECVIPRSLAAQIPAGEHGVLALRFNNAGTLLVAALQIDGDFAIQFYETERLLLTGTIRAHINLIYELTFAGDDRHLLSVSSDGMAKVWCTETRELRRSLPHSNYLYTGKFHPKKDHFVATAGFDGILRIWNRSKGQCIAEGVPHKARINSIVFSPDGEKIYSGDSAGVICVWRFTHAGDTVTLVREQEVRHREIDGVAITHLSMGKGLYALLVYTQDDLVRNFETEPMEVVQRFTGARCRKFMMESGFSPDQKYVFAGSETGSVILWLVKNREPVQVVQWAGNFARPVTSVAWNPEKDMVAFSSFAPGQTILVFDTGGNPTVRLRARKIRELHPLPP